MTAKVKYNRKLLEQVCERDNCIIDFDNIKKYNRDIRIEFVCCCGNNYNKQFQYLVKLGGFCKTCTEIKRQNKIKKTCLDRYGFDNISKSQQYKEKYTATCLNKYGVNNPSKSEEIKNKKKDTCLKNYGVNNPSKSEEIKNQKKETCLKNHGVEHPFQLEQIRDKENKQV
jgi:hypothetical protein